MLRDDILEWVHTAELKSKTLKRYQLQASVLQLTQRSYLQEGRQTERNPITLLLCDFQAFHKVVRSSAHKYHIVFRYYPFNSLHCFAHGVFL